MFVLADATILHADVDAFFAAVEQRDRPELRGRPVLVGGGVVLCPSYEAKARGVQTAMGVRRALRLCPGAIVVRPRMSAYSEASKAVYRVFDDTTPLVEGLSIDEAFLDVTDSRSLFGDGAGAETVDSWFDKTAFQTVTSGTFGNSGRNILRGPGLVNVDTALQRRFRVGGQTAVELRWEVFNIFNMDEFGLPDSNISNATFGTIQRLAGDPRVMQFALRVIF
jgi:nucleotidyltransferase/DNA polymerase involved in DNA repair